jgi:hypothetical protein
VLCEGVFQHLADPLAAMAELVRITRPGGRIVVIDTDWGLHAIHGADPSLTATIGDAWARTVADGFACRQLCALFGNAGLRDPTVLAETGTSTDPLRPSSPPFTTMAAAAAHWRRQRHRRPQLAGPACRRRAARPVLLGSDDVRRRRRSPLAHQRSSPPTVDHRMEQP